MADTQLPYLTPEQLLQYQSGNLRRGAAVLKNHYQTPAYYGQGDFVTPIVDAFSDGGVVAGAGDFLQEKPLWERPAFGITDMARGINQFGHQLQQPNLDSIPAVNNAKALAGGVISLPFDALTLASEAAAPIAQNAVNALTKTERQIQEEERAAQQAQIQNALAGEDAAQMRVNAFDQVFGGGRDPNAPIVIGPAQSGGGGGYTLPPPPGPQDFSPVQEAIDKTKPVWDEEAMAERKKGAILTGLVGGILQASMNGEGIGEGAGLGALMGMSQAQQDLSKEQRVFKEGLEKYWLRTADVRKAQGEAEQDYAQRVYQTRVAQLRINADAAQARASANRATLRQAGDKFYVEETVNGQRQMRMLDMGLVDNTIGMTREVTRLLGGSDEAKNKAQSIVAEVVSRKDPDYAMPAIVTARLKDTGTYLDFVQDLGSADEDWLKSFNSVGTQAASMGMDDKSAQGLADRRRDAMIMDLLKNSSAARQIAYRYTGMDEQYLNEKAKSSAQTPTLK